MNRPSLASTCFLVSVAIRVWYQCKRTPYDCSKGFMLELNLEISALVSDGNDKSGLMSIRFENFFNVQLVFS